MHPTDITWFLTGAFVLGIVFKDISSFIVKNVFYDSVFFTIFLASLGVVILGPVGCFFLLGSYFNEKNKEKNLEKINKVSDNIRFLIEHKDGIQDLELEIKKMTGEEFDFELEKILEEGKAP